MNLLILFMLNLPPKTQDLFIIIFQVLYSFFYNLFKQGAGFVICDVMDFNMRGTGYHRLFVSNVSIIYEIRFAEIPRYISGQRVIFSQRATCELQASGAGVSLLLRVHWCLCKTTINRFFEVALTSNRSLTMDFPYSLLDTDVSVIDLSITHDLPENLETEGEFDLVKYLDNDVDDFNIPYDMPKVFNDDMISADPSLSINQPVNSAAQIDSSSTGFHDGQTIPLVPLNSKVAHQPVMANSAYTGLSNSPICDEQKTVTSPAECFGSLAYKQEPKRKPEDASTSSLEQRPTRVRMYEIQTPFEDRNMERRRKNAQNSRKHREVQKKQILDLQNTLATVLLEKEKLRQEIERMRLREESLRQMIQFYLHYRKT